MANVFTQGTILNSDFKEKNPTPINRDMKIYRTISKKRLFEIFASGQNALARPKLWVDKFESLALQSQANLNGEIVSFAFKDDIYSQCWTEQSFSDAMWQIYSNGNDGIRIRSTVGKLLDSLSATMGDNAPTSSFIGKVEYLTDQQLKDFADTHFVKSGLGSDAKSIAASLLIKRNAFIHEKEIRLVFVHPKKPPIERDLHFYSLDPHILIDQIMLHPGLNDNESASLKSEIQTKLNFKGELKKSLLYKPPKGFVFKISE